MLRATEGLAEPPSPRIEMRHFQTAMQRITPSVSLKVFLAYYTCLPAAGGSVETWCLSIGLSCGGFDVVICLGLG